MKKETFLELLSDIDDNLIDEAETPLRKNNRNLIKYIATAACICVVLGGSVVGSFIGDSNEKNTNTEIVSNNKVAKVEKEDILDTTSKENEEMLASNSEEACMVQDQCAPEKKESKSADKKKSSENLEENNLYDGEGSGEFVYNEKTYRIVNSIEYLASNSLPTKIKESDVGLNLANNVYDTANSNIGNIYKYKNDESETILIVQGMDGIYNIAVEE